MHNRRAFVGGKSGVLLFYHIWTNLPMSKSQQRYPTIEVIDQEKLAFFMVKNEIVTEYRPLIGGTGLDLYCLYKQMANRKAGETLYPSMQFINAHLGLAEITISCNNWLLECCALLKIETGDARTSNRYTLLPVNPVTPKLLAKLTEALQPKASDGQRWAKFKASRLEAVVAWQPLSAHFKAPRPTSKVSVTNGQAPQPPSADLPSQAELVAYMTDNFIDGQKPLSEAAAIKMIEQYGLEAVDRQLGWLAGRETDNPLRTLRAALKDNWREPKPIGKPEPEPWYQDVEHLVLK
jgi:hypothetical protein